MGIGENMKESEVENLNIDLKTDLSRIDVYLDRLNRENNLDNDIDKFILRYLPEEKSEDNYIFVTFEKIDIYTFKQEINEPWFYFLFEKNADKYILIKKNCAFKYVLINKKIKKQLNHFDFKLTNEDLLIICYIEEKKVTY